jgi:hypothetical protein
VRYATLLYEVDQSFLSARTHRGFYPYRVGELDQIIVEPNEILIKLLCALNFRTGAPHPPTCHT